MESKHESNQTNAEVGSQVGRCVISDEGICPDFDSDCADVPVPAVCFTGHEPRLMYDFTTLEVYMGYVNMAKGKCPYL